MSKTNSKTDYALTKRGPDKRMRAPELPYKPQNPRRYKPRIGLIGCGGITDTHLKAYKNAGYRVVAFCDVQEELARKRKRDYYPRAKVHTSYAELLDRDDIDVVDIATHPAERAVIIEAALQAGKHVLSQKPFVLELDVGERLARLADEKNLRLAVNQNGRWAPYFSYMRQAIAAGLIGDVNTVDFTVHWDHNWVKDTVFNNIHHLILYDFAIHWFDMCSVFFGGREAKHVYASVAHAPHQQAAPPLLAHAAVEYEGGMATLSFNANCRFGQEDRTVVIGDKGTLKSVGPGIVDQKVTLYTEDGYGSPKLEGTWFPDGFHGAMAELLCAIEEHREPSNSARNNLRSVALCFAAVASADDGVPKTPGTVRGIVVSDEG